MGEEKTVWFNTKKGVATTTLAGQFKIDETF